MNRRGRFALLIVLAFALACGCSARREREATLKEDLLMMRQAIDQYTLDKQQPTPIPARLGERALLEGDSDGPVYSEKRLGAIHQRNGS